jgi:hypothetical protein
MPSPERDHGHSDTPAAEPAAKSARRSEPLAAGAEATNSDTRPQQQQRSRAKTAAVAVEQGYLHALWEVQQQPCICKMAWCAQARRKHVLGKKTAQLPDDLAAAREQMKAYNTHARPAERLTDDEIDGYCTTITAAQASTPSKGRQHPEYKTRRMKPAFAMIHYHSVDRTGTIGRMKLATATKAPRDLLNLSLAQQAQIPPLPTRPEKGGLDFEGVINSPHYANDMSTTACSGCPQCMPKRVPASAMASSGGRDYGGGADASLASQAATPVMSHQASSATSQASSDGVAAAAGVMTRQTIQRRAVTGAHGSSYEGGGASDGARTGDGANGGGGSDRWVLPIGPGPPRVVKRP